MRHLTSCYSDLSHRNTTAQTSESSSLTMPVSTVGVWGFCKSPLCKHLFCQYQQPHHQLILNSGKINVCIALSFCKKPQASKSFDLLRLAFGYFHSFLAFEVSELVVAQGHSSIPANCPTFGGIFAHFWTEQ